MKRPSPDKSELETLVEIEGCTFETGVIFPSLIARMHYPQVADPWSMGHMQLRMAINAGQQKCIYLLKTVSVLISFHYVCVFNVWPKTTLLIPGWIRDTKMLDTPASPIILTPVAGQSFPPMEVAVEMQAAWTHLIGCVWNLWGKTRKAQRGYGADKRQWQTSGASVLLQI